MPAVLRCGGSDTASYDPTGNWEASTQGVHDPHHIHVCFLLLFQPHRVRVPLLCIHTCQSGKTTA